MKINKIVIKALPSNTNQPIPEPLEIEPSQVGLIPGIGDRYMGYMFSMNVVRRKFEVDGDTMYIFLEG